MSRDPFLGHSDKMSVSKRPQLCVLQRNNIPRILSETHAGLAGVAVCSHPDYHEIGVGMAIHPDLPSVGRRCVARVSSVEKHVDE